MIERIFDYRKIKSLASWDYIISSDAIYLIDEDFGLWGFVPYNGDKDTYEAHIDINPKYRGKQALDKCKEIIRWIFENTSATRIIGQIPWHNRKACFNAVNCGLNFIGLDKEDELIRLYEVRK